MRKFIAVTAALALALCAVLVFAGCKKDEPVNDVDSSETTVKEEQGSTELAPTDTFETLEEIETGEVVVEGNSDEITDENSEELTEVTSDETTYEIVSDPTTAENTDAE